ncbi:MAG TPA: hypothetical protein VMJ10_32565 [Kofleriaceae bacterium]|nr:hypothetical protein [Kofleriaceae bacterium]
MRIAGISASIGLSVAVVACTSGDENSNHDTRGITCQDNYTVTGNFVMSSMAGSGRPTGQTDGCWPVGMWTFTVALDTTMTNTCTPTPTPLPQYQFEGDLATDPDDPTGPPIQTFKYDTDPTDTMTIIKVTEGGAGDAACEGELDLYSPDGTQMWLLKPEADTTNATGTITGSGQFTIYTMDQWPY